MILIIVIITAYIVRLGRNEHETIVQERL